MKAAICAAWLAFAAWSLIAETEPSGSYANSDELRNSDVVDKEGKTIGKVIGLIFDSKSGQLEFVVVQSGGFLGLGERSCLVPWKMFGLDENAADHNTRLTLDTTVEKLQQGIAYDANTSIPADAVYTYWGVEREGEKATEAAANPGQTGTGPNPKLETPVTGNPP